jgi:hypothetical protein
LATVSQLINRTNVLRTVEQLKVCSLKRDFIALSQLTYVCSDV